ncbi:heme-binding protein [Hydrogenophaga sp. PAMC20947]|uniref:GlcG/HbpS family heme-binding protein n=1 Tax=Hydrogenophaga sp. PAMC20947 TaxID=2565558 RepID=UPI00109DF5FC|nr:heme-binding protein [Hydrogenophaga sp. PAMC20947]QCB47464.1 heme-binding protein [Hydrogenophaga sp. PAMC20947]
MRMRHFLMAAGLSIALPAMAQTASGTFQIKVLTPETALMAAQAAMAACRAQGYQVAVAVVDRSGLAQVFLRDRYAGAHTFDVAINKAWTAASFRTPTLELANESQPGKPMSGIRSTPRMLAVGGGLVIEGAGSVFGGIGVSGAPGGEADEACARAGLDAIADRIEF